MALEFLTIEYAKLTEAQQNKIDELTNDTIPQGQSFFLENGEVIVIENNLKELYVAQNRPHIEGGFIQEII